MIPDKKYEEMERYVNSEMTNDQRVSFEKEMEQNNELEKVVALYKDIPNRLNNIEADLDFNQKLQNARNNYSQTSNKSTSWKWIFISIISIVIIGFVWKQLSNNTEKEEIQEQQNLPENVPIASLWEDTDMPPAYISRGGEGVDIDIKIYQDAHQLYAQDKFVEALTTLETIDATSKISGETLLLKGVCQYEIKQYDDAINTYGKYIELDLEPKDMVLWYQSLAFIQAKQADKAKINLQSIIDSDYSKAQIAKELLKTL